MSKEKHPLEILQEAGVTIHETHELPDGSGFATGSLPLPEDHWLYGNPEYSGDYEPPPMPMKMGTDDPRRQEFTEALCEAGKYALRAATMNGKEEDFDPDALIKNLVVGMLGYFTDDGLSHEDGWANPKRYRKE